MKTTHTNNGECLLCNDKILTAHEMLQAIFKIIKSKFEDVHISWAWRDKENQDLFFKEGKSRAQWPHSQHNVTDGPCSHPCSHAIDLFQLGKDGVAYFPYEYYEKIDSYLKSIKAPVEWSGTWTHFKEYPHFQLVIDD